MGRNLFFYSQYIYQNITLKDFISGYFKKKEQDQNVLKVYCKSSTKTEYLMKKTIPYCFQLFSEVSDMEFQESISISEHQVEINVWKNRGEISSQVNMIIFEDVFKKQTILKAVFNCTNIPSLLRSKIRNYITQEFVKEREKEEQIIKSNSNL